MVSSPSPAARCSFRCGQGLDQSGDDVAAASSGSTVVRPEPAPGDAAGPGSRCSTIASAPPPRTGSRSRGSPASYWPRTSRRLVPTPTPDQHAGRADGRHHRVGDQVLTRRRWCAAATRTVPRAGTGSGSWPAARRRRRAARSPAYAVRWRPVRPGREPGPIATRSTATSTCRRDQRSRTTPTNGPRIENGSKVMASTVAMEAASGWRSGEKSTYEASAICSTPSHDWVAIRTASSRRKYLWRQSCRRLRTNSIA